MCAARMWRSLASPWEAGKSRKTVPIDPSGRAAARAITASRLLEYDGAPQGLFATESRRLSEDLISFLR